MTPIPRTISISPAQLEAVANRLDTAGRQLGHARRHLTTARGRVRLNDADPKMNSGRVRSATKLLSGRLQTFQAEMAADAEHCRATAAAATTADAPEATNAADAGGRDAEQLDRGLVCLTPDRVRRPVDAVVTRGLAHAARLVVRATVSAIGPVDGNQPVGDNQSGDPGGTFTARLVALDGADRFADLGRSNVVTLGLAAAGDQDLLKHDEFGLIEHGDQKYTVVLPGVTDLSAPRRDWHPHHRSVRDLDMVAIESAGDNGMDTNLYASMVADGLAATGVEDGAELTLIGHSFGADTALDLAGDSRFANRFEIAHVVATGFYSQPQLANIPLSVDVVVVQNRNDLIVRAEALMPNVAEGVLDCDVDHLEWSPGVQLVRFDGGLAQLGHDIDGYRELFAFPGQLPEPEAQLIGRLIDDLDQDGFTPTTTMVAIDISVPST